MRVLLAVAFTFLTCLGLCDSGWEKNLAEVRAMRLAAPRKWAIVIGASDYAELGELKYARDDAREFAQALIDDFTFKPQDVTLLVDKDKPEIAPTSKNISAQLDRVFKDPRLDKGDLFIFYFNGHGVGTKNGDFLCPTDATRANPEKGGLPVKDVIKRIVATGMKNVLIIADACRAGEKNPFGAELQELGDKANLAVLLGCAPGKRSYEYPSLKGGAFTHFLMENMRSPDTRDLTTGAVWASRLADLTKKEVFEFTEKDHGKYAQQPASWNEQTQDVLLVGLSPQSEGWQKVISQALEGRAKLGESAQVSAITDVAYVCTKMGYFSDAIRLLKMVEQLGPMSPRQEQLLALSLQHEGRDAEALRVYDRIIAQSSGIQRDAAILQSSSPSIPLADKAKASEAIWKADHQFLDAVGCLLFAQGENERLRLLKVFVAYYGKDSKPGSYFAAQQPNVEKDQVLWACLEKPGDPDITHVALQDLQSYYVDKRDRSGELKVIGEGISRDTTAKFHWAVELASFNKGLKRPDKTIEILRKALASGEPKDPGRILNVVDIAGIRAHELLPELEPILAKNPASWQLQSAIWLAKSSAELSPSFQIPDEVKRYAPDPVALRFELFTTMYSMVDEMPDLDSTTRLLFNTKFFISMIAQHQFIDADPLVWAYLLRWAEDCGRTRELNALAEMKIYPIVLSGRSPTRLTETAFTLAMYTGDDPLVDKIWKVSLSQGAGRTDEAWKYITYLVARQRYDEAKAWLPKMPKPGDWVGPQMPVLVQACLDAASGIDAKKVQDVLAEMTPDGVEATYLWAYANAMSGGGERSARIFSALIDPYNHGQLHLKSAGMRFLWEKSVKEGKDDEVAALGDLASRFFGNPLLKGVTYQAKPKISDYAGVHRFNARYMDQGGVKHSGSGVMEIIVKPDGTLTAKMEGLSFSGRVDEGGDMTAAGAWDGDKMKLFMKLPPLGTYKSYADKGAQPLMAIDQNWETVVMELTFIAGR